MTLEEALRQRYWQVCANIGRDQALADEFRDKTHLRTGEQKRWHTRQLERVQVEWYKHDELKLVAGRAGIDLYNEDTTKGKVA